MTIDRPPCERLEWDSAFFGHAIARATALRLTPDDWQEVERWCRAHKIDCLYLLTAPADSATTHVIEAAGCRFVDIRMTLDREIGQVDTPAAGPGIREATLEDIPSLRAIAAEAHRNTRFRADGRFDPDRCDELYRVWIEQSCRGQADGVLVAEHAGSPVGYLTLHLDEGGRARIGLLGVSRHRQRCGIGRQLVLDGLIWLASRGATRVSVVTQGANVVSQRLYQGMGFRTSDLALWHHRWFS